MLFYQNSQTGMRSFFNGNFPEAQRRCMNPNIILNERKFRHFRCQSKFFPWWFTTSFITGLQIFSTYFKNRNKRGPRDSFKLLQKQTQEVPGTISNKNKTNGINDIVSNYFKNKRQGVSEILSNHIGQK